MKPYSPRLARCSSADSSSELFRPCLAETEPTDQDRRFFPPPFSQLFSARQQPDTTHSSLSPSAVPPRVYRFVFTCALHVGRRSIGSWTPIEAPFAPLSIYHSFIPAPLLLVLSHFMLPSFSTPSSSLSPSQFFLPSFFGGMFYVFGGARIGADSLPRSFIRRLSVRPYA